MLAQNRIAAGPEIGKLRSDYTTLSSYDWNHDGIDDGTNALIFQQTSNDLTFSILFNRRSPSGHYSQQLSSQLQPILNGITNWPAPLSYAGDLSDDQWLTGADIGLFTKARATSEWTFSQLYPDALYHAGDFDGDGIVGRSDVPGMMAALRHAGVPPADIARLVELPGDYNQNDVVDSADYVMWRNHLYQAVNLPNETTSFGVVDHYDYEVWRANFGMTLPAGAQIGAIVPEPNTIAIVACVLLIGLASRPCGFWERV
jgi:hypothetical protein